MLQLPPQLTLDTLDSHMVSVQGGIFVRGSGDSTHKVQLDDFDICRYPNLHPSKRYVGIGFRLCRYSPR
ncbi:MAG: hypothetical protein AAGA10_01750 [Bacteroidota bacterium]